MHRKRFTYEKFGNFAYVYTSISTIVANILISRIEILNILYGPPCRISIIKNKLIVRKEFNL